MLYRVHGLTIRSELPLPELVPVADGALDDSAADAEVRLASLGGEVADLQARSASVGVTEREARFLWEDAGALVVRDGREILVEPLPGSDPTLVRLGVLGPGMAALLHQRGFLVLHASAVRMGGAIVAFLGMAGAGKSTLAAMLQRRGLPVVADDMAAVRICDGVARVACGSPQLRLWPDSVRALGGDPGALPRCEPDREKRLYPTVVEQSPEARLALDRLYVLADGDAVEIGRLSPAEAFLELVIHSYGAEWMHDISGRADFSTRAEIARRVPVRRLRRPSGLHVLPDVLDLLERDLADDRR